MDWAKHRRRKAAVKCHMRLDLQTFLPRFAIAKEADTHDSAEAAELCAEIRVGEIVVFDKAYVDFRHLYNLHRRGIFWVTRAKDNMAHKVVGQHPTRRPCVPPRIELICRVLTFDLWGSPCAATAKSLNWGSRKIIKPTLKQDGKSSI